MTQRILTQQELNAFHNSTELSGYAKVEGYERMANVYEDGTMLIKLESGQYMDVTGEKTTIEYTAF
jgi:hypothetical protein